MVVWCCIKFTLCGYYSPLLAAGRFIVMTPLNSKHHPNRRFAIGDVHGCCRTLHTMIEDVIQLEQADTLYLLGDYIDRGPNSKGVLDYLMHLARKGYDIRPLMGNHERMMLKARNSFEADNRWRMNGGCTTLHDFGVKKASEIPDTYFDFLEALPLIHVLDDYVLVHSGLHFGVPDPIKDTPEFFLLWDRDYKVLPEKLAGRTLITGHTVHPLFEIRASLDTPHILLDNGCYDKGHICHGNLVALNLDTRELLVQENCENTIR